MRGVRCEASTSLLFPQIQIIIYTLLFSHHRILYTKNNYQYLFIHKVQTTSLRNTIFKNIHHKIDPMHFYGNITRKFMRKYWICLENLITLRLHIALVYAQKWAVPPIMHRHIITKAFRFNFRNKKSPIFYTEGY